MNSDPRTYNSARNLTMSFIQKLVSILLTFIGRQIFIQILSVEYLGINRLFGDIITMLSLADLGLATAMAYSFYKPLAERDEDKLSALIGFYRTVYHIIAAIVAVVGIALTPFLRYIINLEAEIPYIEVYYLLTLSQTVISYLFIYKASIVTADQKSRVITKYSVWISIILSAVQITVLLISKNYMVYCIIPIFGTLANNLILSRNASRLYPFLKKKVRLAEADRRDIFHNIKSMFIYKIATVIFTGTDNIFISALLGTAIVGQYANYSLAVTNLSAIAFLIFSSLTPSIGNLIVKERPEKRLQIFRVMQTVSHWLSGFFIFCLFFLLDDFVFLWIGREFIFNMPVKIIVLINLYMSLTLYPAIAFREATGIYQKTKYVMLTAAVIKIILSLILGRVLGLVGIVLATNISKLVTYAWYEPRVLFRDFFNGRAITYLISHIQNITILVICIALAYFALPWPESSGWLSWILKGVLCAIGINAVYFIKYYKTPEFLIIISKAKSLLKIKN